MIANDRQYRITRAEARRFEEAVDAARREDGPKSEARLRRAIVEGLESQLRDLRNEIAHYEALRAGNVRRRIIDSFHDLPIALIEARIAARMTQKQLAGRLGLPEQQIQRYESTGYAGVSVQRVQDVVDALGVTIRKEIRYAHPAKGGASKQGRARTKPKRRARPEESRNRS